jgi:Right handed beta helix region
MIVAQIDKHHSCAIRLPRPGEEHSMNWKLLIASIVVLPFWSPSGQAQSCPVNDGKAWITDYGAMPTPAGATPTIDNLPAIRAAIACARKSSVPVYVPPGTFSFGRTTDGPCSVDRRNNTARCPRWFLLDGVQMAGDAPQHGNASRSILYALDNTSMAIVLGGNGAQLRNLTLAQNGTNAARQGTPQAAHVWIYGVDVYPATNFVVDGLTISLSGIMVYGAGPGVISNNTISDTLADSIHMTNATFPSHDIEVRNNTITRSGDDGIVVLSYNPGSYVHNINIHDNHIHNNIWGRNMAVVGGQNVIFANNLADGNLCCACLYIAGEDNAQVHTLASFDVTAHYNTLAGCGHIQGGYAAVTIASYVSSYTNNNITLSRNQIIPNVGQPAIGIIGYNDGVVLCKNTGPGYSYPNVARTSAVTASDPYVAGDDVGYISGRTTFGSCP